MWTEASLAAVTVHVGAGPHYTRSNASWAIVGDFFRCVLRGLPGKGVHLSYPAKVTHVNVKDNKDDVRPIEEIDKLDLLLLEWAYSGSFDLFCKY